MNDLGDLRRAAKQNSPEALQGAAKQFEALFINMMLKSMRDASPQNGIFNSPQDNLYTSMLDQQLSQTIASRGIGIAEMLVHQLSNQNVSAGNSTTPSDPPSPSHPASDAIRSRPANPPHIKAFVEKHAVAAQQASAATGIPAKFLLGQAALESGWGKHEIVGSQGDPTYNLFGIKAAGGWKGKNVVRATTEYIDGVPQTKLQKFRAYGSYAEAFQDYAKFMQNNPRYQKVLASAQTVSGFANGLQRAGYATDPNYAAKLTKIIRGTMT